MPVTNLTLRNVNIAASKPFSIYSAQGVQLIDSQITVPASTNAINLYNAQVTITNTVTSTNLVTLGGLANPLTNNALAFFNALATITDTNLLGTGAITLGDSTLAFSQASVNFSNPLNILSASTLMVTNGANDVRRHAGRLCSGDA